MWLVKLYRGGETTVMGVPRDLERIGWKPGTKVMITQDEEDPSILHLKMMVVSSNGHVEADETEVSTSPT